MKLFTLIMTLMLCSNVVWAKPSSNLPPAQALQKLKRGNERYVSGKPTSCVSDDAKRALLIEGQAPDAIILACSDSRVPPEVVFDQGLGHLFTIRVAGNVLTDETTASIEYALEHLGTRLIVVMGHESCGAIKAALSTPKGKSAGSPSLDTLVTDIQKNLANKSYVNSSKDPLLLAPVKDNVSAVAHDLLRRSQIVRNAVQAGKVKVTESIYSLNDGKVEFWD